MQKFTALDYLKIDIVNLYGKDKLSWVERIAWFDEHKDDLLDMTKEADAPSQFYAAVKNYFRVCDGGINYHPITLDATSSGTQILSCLTRDEDAAKYCNVLDVGYRMDAYTVLFNKFKERLGDEFTDDGTFTRAKIKDAIMVALYGSVKGPKDLFDEYLEDFFELMREEFPIVWALNEALSSEWNPKVGHYGWVMPDNFNVFIKVYNKESYTVKLFNRSYEVIKKVNAPSPYGKAYPANFAHSIDSLIVREITALAMHEPKKIEYVHKVLEGVSTRLPKDSKAHTELVKTLVQRYEESGFLSARILNHIHKGNIEYVPLEPLKELLDAVPAKPFQIMTTHDSFRVLPNYGNDLRELYNLQLAKVTRSSILENVLDSLPISQITVDKGDLNWKDILNAEYALS